MTEHRTRIITIRLTPTEHAELQAEGPNVTAAVRARLGFDNGRSDELADLRRIVDVGFAAFGERVRRLEQLAGDNL